MNNIVNYETTCERWIVNYKKATTDVQKAVFRKKALDALDDMIRNFEVLKKDIEREVKHGSDDKC